ncbi:MAG: tRNA (adenosine(37)-N6)-threonylcarbamoyltransferase complex transferase subunit TsaD [Opitutaceae bacterium]
MQIDEEHDSDGALDGLILAIETSCDESAVALFHGLRGLEKEWISSQIELHGAYGGVVPDLASREHLTNLPLLLEEVSENLGPIRRPRAIAVTQGPGLAGCLAMGLSAGKALALAWNCPLFAINHLRAHAFSPFIEVHRGDPRGFPDRLQRLLPHLGLVVSGGNTLLIRLDQGPVITLLGGTVDDAAGEALDKGAKLLGLGYPGGPLIERAAVSGKADAVTFPRALLRAGNHDFSFSGLKTSLRYRIEKMDTEEVTAALADLCAGYQEAVVDVLARKVAAGLADGEFRSIGLSGGVANNRSLRSRLEGVAADAGVAFLAALPRHTGDNAGMIAFAAWMERSRLEAAEDFAATIRPGVGIED